MTFSSLNKGKDDPRIKLRAYLDQGSAFQLDSKDEGYNRLLPGRKAAYDSLIQKIESKIDGDDAKSAEQLLTEIQYFVSIDYRLTAIAHGTLAISDQIKKDNEEIANLFYSNFAKNKLKEHNLIYLRILLVDQTLAFSGKRFQIKNADERTDLLFRAILNIAKEYFEKGQADNDSNEMPSIKINELRKEIQYSLAVQQINEIRKKIQYSLNIATKLLKANTAERKEGFFEPKYSQNNMVLLQKYANGMEELLNYIDTLQKKPAINMVDNLKAVQKAVSNFEKNRNEFIENFEVYYLELTKNNDKLIAALSSDIQKIFYKMEQIKFYIDGETPKILAELDSLIDAFERNVNALFYNEAQPLRNKIQSEVGSQLSNSEAREQLDVELNYIMHHGDHTWINFEERRNLLVRVGEIFVEIDKIIKSKMPIEAKESPAKMQFINLIYKIIVPDLIRQSPEFYSSFINDFTELLVQFNERGVDFLLNSNLFKELSKVNPALEDINAAILKDLDLDGQYLFYKNRLESFANMHEIFNPVIQLIIDEVNKSPSTMDLIKLFQQIDLLINTPNLDIVEAVDSLKIILSKTENLNEKIEAIREFGESVRARIKPSY